MSRDLDRRGVDAGPAVTWTLRQTLTFKRVPGLWCWLLLTNTTNGGACDNRNVFPPVLEARSLKPRSLQGLAARGL